MWLTPKFKTLIYKNFLVWRSGFYSANLRDFWFSEDWRSRNLAVEVIPQLDLFHLPFSMLNGKSRQKWKKLRFFDLNLIFSLARTLCKNLALNGVVLFSQFRFSHFSSVPAEIWQKCSTKQKIKKMTLSYLGTRLQISFYILNNHYGS